MMSEGYVFKDITIDGLTLFEQSDLDEGWTGFQILLLESYELFNARTRRSPGITARELNQSAYWRVTRAGSRPKREFRKQGRSS